MPFYASMFREFYNQGKLLVNQNIYIILKNVIAQLLQSCQTSQKKL